MIKDVFGCSTSTTGDEVIDRYMDEDKLFGILDEIFNERLEKILPQDDEMSQEEWEHLDDVVSALWAIERHLARTMYLNGIRDWMKMEDELKSKRQ